MQTFLPFESFERSAEVLDNRRLGKQRVEALQILRALTVPGYGWQRHPAVAMWRGFQSALFEYGLAVCWEWKRRGFQDTCGAKMVEIMREIDAPNIPPFWLGNEAFHLSHRSNLIRKDPAFYRPVFGEGVPDDLPYVWPASAAHV